MARKPQMPDDGRPISLKMLAESLDLSPATVSLVMNNAPGIRSIPEHTRKRVLEAAKKLKYQPNFFARSLRTRQSFAIGIIIPEPSEGYFPMIMKGVEQPLVQAGYFFFLASHLWREDLIEEYPRLLMKRGVDGLMLINTPLKQEVPLPVVAIPGHKSREGVTNIVLDHMQATQLAMKHLCDLGHRRIAFMKGPSFTQDVNARWDGVLMAARSMGLPVLPELFMNFEASEMAPDMGYSVVRNLLSKTRDFTAIFCFNDTTAIGAIRALRDAGLRCPEDVSIIGFDDILGAAYHTPSITTIRQPLRQMGEAASELLLRRIRDSKAPYPREMVLLPELVVRESTSMARRPALPAHAKRTAKSI
ncbi:MAG TPA: LacI family DNA-binding transcriptional regulator [Acidobacteriaceae bacterium]|jgi:LacI family transcriptional regulator|nr:LacI family DNA-binding transcriptional regulator [Acidobacteriaceae bacterium]